MQFFFVLLVPVFLFLSGYMHVWITEGRSTFWKGLSKRAIIEIFALIHEAKNNGEDYTIMLKRFFIGYGVMLVFVGLCLLYVFWDKIVGSVN